MLLTNDYVWGHSTSNATKALVEANGGKIIDNLLVPQNTRDFTSYLLKIQQAKPDVVAAAIGGDDIKALRAQVAQLKLDGKPAWINNQQDWPDVWGAPESLFGVFGTTWYHKLQLPGVDAFVKRWQATYKDSPIPVPGNVSYNGYMATQGAAARDRARRLDQQYRRDQAAREPENLGGGPHAALRRLHGPGHAPDAADGLSRPAQHEARRQHRLLRDHQSWTEPKAVTDDAAPGKCKLAAYEQVPTYEL